MRLSFIQWRLYQTSLSILNHFTPIYLQIVLNMQHYGKAIPANNYMFKVNNRNTRIRCEICSKLTIKTPE